MTVACKTPSKSYARCMYSKGVDGYLTANCTKNDLQSVPGNVIKDIEVCYIINTNVVN